MKQRQHLEIPVPVVEGEDPKEYIKNPVVAEFMGFRKDAKFDESDLEQALPGLKKFPTDDLDHLWEIWEVYKNESRLGMESDRIRTCTCTARRYHAVLYLYSFAIG